MLPDKGQLLSTCIELKSFVLSMLFGLRIPIPDLDILVVAGLQISRQMSNNLSFHDGPHAVRDHPRLGTETTW